MKTNYNFDELSKVFASVSKIEKLAAAQIEAEKAYNEKGNAFDAEFAKYNYSFFNAPKELHVMFNEKCALMDARDKAEKKAYKAVKEFAAFVEAGNGPTDWVEDEVKAYVERKSYFLIDKIARYCTYLAVDIANRVRC